ncbi:MAG TPA: hypothetical protein VII00_07460 [bacterium]
MNIIALNLWIFLILLSANCQKNAFEEYGNSAVQKYQNAQQLDERITLQQVQEAIRAFYAANGHYPENIEEVEKITGISMDEGLYEYSPSSGILSLKK